MRAPLGADAAAAPRGCASPRRGPRARGATAACRTPPAARMAAAAARDPGGCGDAAADVAVARVALLRLQLGAQQLRACPTGLLRAAAGAASERLYVVCDARGDADAPCHATLRWCALAYDAVAAARPTLDARLLFPFAGWDAAAVAALQDVEVRPRVVKRAHTAARVC
jgi:hypothetical protein